MITAPRETLSEAYEVTTTSNHDLAIDAINATRQAIFQVYRASSWHITCECNWAPRPVQKTACWAEFNAIAVKHDMVGEYWLHALKVRDFIRILL